MDVETHWRALVTAALLGTDRRDPPDPEGPIADLVADTTRTAPSERMLTQVAACASVRRAGTTPGPVIDPLAGPEPDDRPCCVPAAAARWHHVVASWPVLEDEWVLVAIANGWRVPPELVPVMLERHRSDPVRWTRVCIAAGPVAGWLVDHLPSLGSTRRPPAELAELVGELPALPIPPELAALCHVSGDAAGAALRAQLSSGGLGAPHRSVLVNLVARMAPDALGAVAARLGEVDPGAPGHGLAAGLADLALTRQRMLAELQQPGRH